MRFAAILLLAAAPALPQAVPQWVTDAARQTVPEFSAKVETVVLLQEEQLTVDEAGRRTMRERGAIRILQPGPKAISASRAYNTKSGRIREFKAWLVPASGKPVTYGRDRIVDRALSRGDTYGEGRLRAVDFDPNAAVGSVLAWEILDEETTVFTTYQHGFQGREPVLVSRFVLNLPRGWEARGRVLNRDGTEPRVEGQTHTWELRDLPRIEPEPWSPRWSALAPRLALTYWPSAGGNASLRPMNEWRAVSEWLHELTAPSFEVTPEIRAKAAELTTGAVTELDRIRAIAEFTQQVNYVSVQMNLTRGGGYVPKPAGQVLQRNYGDCKDKSGLMRTLLDAAGLKAWLTVVYSGDRDYVRGEWPSPSQFNHAIVAVEVSEATEAPTVLVHPELGRLLFFDPTDTATPLGDLDEDQQGSLALVVAGGRGDLVALPLMDAEANRVESVIEAVIADDGTAKARMTTKYHGQAGSYWRHIMTNETEEEWKKRMERSLSYRVGGVRVDEMKLAGGQKTSAVETEVKYEATRFGRMLQGRLLTVAPGQLTRRSEFLFSARERTLPLRLPAMVRGDEVQVTAPDGFTIDEMPDPVEIETAYGWFRATWEAKGNSIVFKQRLEVKRRLTPAAEYEEARAFFDQAAAAQASAVVLVRK